MKITDSEIANAITMWASLICIFFAPDLTLDMGNADNYYCLMASNNQLADIMTTTEASKYMKLQEGTVRQYLNRGVMRAAKKGPIYLVTRAECDRYLRERKPAGNPNFGKNTTVNR